MILKRRIGVGRSVNLSIITTGSTREFNADNVTIVLVLPGGGKRAVEASSVTPTSVEFWFGKDLQKRLGRYSAIVYIDRGEQSQQIVDFREFVELVPFSHQESVESQTINVEGQLITLGIRGMSAYEVWLTAGHSGTPEDFLDWLRNSTRLDELERRVTYLESLHGITPPGPEPPGPGPEPQPAKWYVGQITKTRTTFAQLTAEQLLNASVAYLLAGKKAELTINESCWFVMVPDGTHVERASYVANGIPSTFTREEIENGFVSGVTHDDVVINDITYHVYVNRNTALVESGAEGEFVIS